MESTKNRLRPHFTKTPSIGSVCPCHFLHNTYGRGNTLPGSSDRHWRQGSGLSEHELVLQPIHITSISYGFLRDNLTSLA